MTPIKCITILLVSLLISCSQISSYNNSLQFKKLSISEAPLFKYRNGSLNQIIQINGYALYITPVIFEDRLKNIIEKNNKFILYKTYYEGRAIYIYEFTKGNTSFVFPEPVLQFDVTIQLLKTISAVLYERVNYLTNK